METAELRAKNRLDITINFWRQNVDGILTFNERPLLPGKGSISNEAMEQKVNEIYALFNQKRKTHEAQQADAQDLEELKQLEEKLKRKS